MTDQTRWRIPEVQEKKIKRINQEQTEMRDDLAFFVLNCSVYELQQMYKEMKTVMKEMKKITLNVEGITQKQWSNKFVLELNLMRKAWKPYGVNVKLHRSWSKKNS